MKKFFIAVVGVLFSVGIGSTNLSAQSDDLSASNTSNVDVSQNPPIDYLGDQTYNTRIYPNPATEFVYVKSEDLVGKSYHITDLTGKQIAVSQTMNDNVITLPVSEYPSGLYFMRFEDGTILKFIVRR
jgi:Secretion system C-terminal sorting domain